jgi:branched-chain amino acid aminotransferase
MTQVWLDGRFLPEALATLPATDRAVLHGRGLFETMRAYRGIPFRCDDHLRRMAASASRFRIPFPWIPADALIRELCRRNRLGDAAVRMTLSGEGRLLITARPRRPVPRAWYARGARVKVATWRRDPRSPLAGHKVTSYLENVLAHEDALKQGYADLLYVGLRNEVLEGSVSNIFLVLEGRLVTPPAAGILPGVARQVVLELAPVRERRVRLEELGRAEEVFLTNSLVEVLPVGRPGPVGRRIARGYRALTRRLR